MKFAIVEKFGKAKDAAIKGGSMMVLKCKKNSPVILLGTGIALGVGATVMACKETLKLEDILEESKEKLQQINDALENEELKDRYSENDAAHDRTIIYSRTIVKTVKNYLPALGLMILSVTCILASYKIMKKRNVALTAAYNGLKLSFDNYRKRVVKKYGVEEDKNLLFGLDEIQNKVEKMTDEEKAEAEKNGSKKASDIPFVSEYAKFFDEGSRCWDKNYEYNKAFLLHQQSIFNEKLNRKGHVFLNEVYDALDIPRTQAGSIVGWTKNGKGDGFIDFGLTSCNCRKNINGYENVWLLDFNVDGIIYDKIGAKF